MPKHVGIIPNVEKPEAIEITRELIRWLQERFIDAILPQGIAEQVGFGSLAAQDEHWFQNVEMLITLGGDGTLLNVANSIVPATTPILGVNLGRLGFLTEIEAPDLFEALPKVIAGEFDIEQRMMLDCSVSREGITVAKFSALNEVTITKGPFARLISLETFINETYVDTYPADGLIIATSTGSTAYSLSAGGPIINPKLSVIIITPICPHTLYSRSLVLSDQEVIRVRVRATHRDTMVTLDGQRAYGLEPQDEVLVRRADHVARLVRLKGWNFYEVLRKKLREGNSRDPSDLYPNSNKEGVS